MSCWRTRRSRNTSTAIGGAGDMVMWDNRCLLHKANGDYDMGQVRYLYRIMLKGDAPV